MQDYAKFVPDAERLIKQFGKIRVLMVMRDFHGWDTGALWEDIKWDSPGLQSEHQDKFKLRFIRSSCCAGVVQRIRERSGKARSTFRADQIFSCLRSETPEEVDFRDLRGLVSSPDGSKIGSKGNAVTSF